MPSELSFKDASGIHYQACRCGAHYTVFRPKRSMQRVEKPMPIFSPYDGSELQPVTAAEMGTFMATFLPAFAEQFAVVLASDLLGPPKPFFPPVSQN